MNSPISLKGFVTYKLYDEDFNLKQEGKSPLHPNNVVTEEGLHYYIDQLSDAGGSPAVLMMLGTSDTAVSTADTWVGSYFAGNGTIGDTQGSLSITTHVSSAAVLQYVGTFEAGYATENDIQRVGIANMVAAADGNGTPNDTTTFFVSHGTIDPTVNKAATDTLVVSWYHELN